MAIEKELAKKVYLGSIAGQGFYVHREITALSGLSASEYLCKNGTWETSCQNGWYRTMEEAQKAFESTVMNISPERSLELLEELHWEERQS